MSDNNHHEEAHTGPIKNPKQLLVAVILSFVVPIFAIIGLVLYVTADNKPAAGSANPEKAIAERIQKIGMVEIRDSNRPLRGGEEVYKGQCAACHATGAAGAPKLGDAAEWGPRIKTGFDTLVQSALKGQNAMAPQGGGEFNDTEIARAVAYMANAGGAKFAEPAAAGAPSADASPASTAAPVAAAAPASAVSANGEALYKQACQVCHGAGIAGAPKFGDKTAWAPRLAAGIDAVYASAVQGKGGMPARGGAQASDEDLRAAVEYMAEAAK